MKKIFIVILIILISLNAQALFEVKDASDNTVLEISNDGLRVFNEGDTLMVISSSEIKAFIDSSTTKALSRSFSVTTSAASGKDVLSNAFEVTTGSAQFNSGLGRYTDFSPDNIFLGLNAGVVTSPNGEDGANNVFIGNSSGITNSSGKTNVFIGNESGYSNSTGNYNTFMGYQSGHSNSNGGDNIYIGYKSGSLNSGGFWNNYIGKNSGANQTSGNWNNFFGMEAGLNNNGFYNIFIGHIAGQNNNGWNNTFLGSQSGCNNNGSRNVFLGNNSGQNAVGSDILYIANSSTDNPLIKGIFPNVSLDLTASNINLNGTLNGNLNSSTSGTNYFRISSSATTQNSGIELFREGTGYYDWRIYNTGGDLRFSVSDDDLATTTDKFRINFSTGNVGIGSTSPGQKLDIYGGYGRVESGYSWLTSSDIRYKTNITTLGNALENVKKMRGVSYDLKVDKDIIPSKGKHIGFIAQELEEIYDELVVDDDKGYKSVSYDKVTAVLVEAVKEQQKMIEEIKFQNEKLLIEIEKLKNK